MNIQEQVANRIASSSNEVQDRVVNLMAEKEPTKRVDLVVRGMIDLVRRGLRHAGRV